MFFISKIQENCFFFFFFIYSQKQDLEIENKTITKYNLKIFIFLLKEFFLTTKKYIYIPLNEEVNLLKFFFLDKRSL